MNIYFKSLLMGVAATLLYLLLLGIVEFAMMPSQVESVGESATITFSPSVLSALPYLVGVPLVFAITFYWTFRRTTKARQPLE
jgi:hypothetical protein